MRFEDLTGQTFGRLKVMRRVEDPTGNYWLCRCKCGGEKHVTDSYNLKCGAVRSCGCLVAEAGRTKAQDLWGNRYGRLKVIKRVENKGRNATWLCRCDCGNKLTVISGELNRGRTQSCGCLKHDKLIERQTTHGHGSPTSKTPTYVTWLAMKHRCYNPNFRHYAYYGGRGIRVCKRWLNSFENFLTDMGERPPGKSLDRFPDLNGDYEPSNCRWATRQEQSRNRRRVDNSPVKR